MKKFLLSISLVLVSLFLFAGCTSFTGIRTAFEREGYLLKDSAEQYRRDAVDVLGADFEDFCTLRVFAKPAGEDGKSGRDVVVIFEFSTRAMLVERTEKSPGLRLVVGDCKTSKRVSGNCLLFLFTDEDAQSVFAKTR